MKFVVMLLVAALIGGKPSTNFRAIAAEMAAVMAAAIGSAATD